MAGSKSNYLENAVLDTVLGHATTVLSTQTNSTVYVALWATTTIDDTFDATSTGECAGSTYARVAVTNSSANWTNASGGSKQNATEVSFTTAAGADWGTVKSFAILDTTSTSAGNILYWANLTSEQTISSGNVVKFSTGSIVITED